MLLLIAFTCNANAKARCGHSRGWFCLLWQHPSQDCILCTRLCFLLPRDEQVSSGIVSGASVLRKAGASVLRRHSASLAIAVSRNQNGFCTLKFLMIAACLPANRFFRAHRRGSWNAHPLHARWTSASLNLNHPRTWIVGGWSFPGFHYAL